MKNIALLSGLTAMFFTVTSSAEGIDIDPGQWEMTTTTTITMTGMSIPPQTDKHNECVEEDELSPEDFNTDTEIPCEISNVNIDDNTAEWSIVCPSDMGTMEGQWVFTSSGDSISGNGSMSANYGGQEMDFKMTWEGKRTGDCEE